MKKLGLCVLALAGVISLAGCNKDEEKVEETKETIVGEYNFSYVTTEMESEGKKSMGTLFTTCPTNTSDFPDLNDSCAEGAGTSKIKVTDTEFTLADKDSKALLEGEYKVDYLGNLYLKEKTNEYGIINIIYKDGKIFVQSKNTTPSDGEYTTTFVYERK